MSEANSMLQQLIEAISMVTSGNPTHLAPGEAALKELVFKDSFIPSLMLIIGDDTFPEGVRILSITQLKYRVYDYWSSKKHPISDLDKKVLKDNLLEAIIRCAGNKKLYRQYEDILGIILHKDKFPAAWPDLVDKTLARASSAGTFNEIMGCVLTMKMILRHFEMVKEEERTEIDKLIETFFPLFEGAAEKLIENYDLQAANVLHPIFRSFFSMSFMGFPPYLYRPENVKRWMAICKSVLEKPVPPELEAKVTDKDDIYHKAKHMFWKNKNWVTRILNMFLMKNTQVRIKDTEESKELSQHWLGNYAPGFLELLLGFIARKNTHFLPPKLLYYSFKYITYALKPEGTYQILQPMLDNIMFDICLPSSILTEDDLEVWQTDAIEFIRREEDFTYIGTSCKNGAADFIEHACRKNVSILMSFIQYVGYCLIENKDPRNGNPISPKLKEAILWTLTIIKDLVLENEGIMDQMETLLEKTVIPELSSSHSYLRARACDVIRVFGFIEFKNRANVTTAFQAICVCLTETELPVRVKACLGLNALLKHEEALEIMKASLGDALREFLKLMELIDSEDVMLGLEGLVDAYSKDIEPFALDLVNHLTATFLKVSANAADLDMDDNDWGEGEMAAAGCLGTIRRILLSHIPVTMFPKFETIMYPIFTFAFSHDGCDYLEEAAELLTILLYNLESVSETTWGFYTEILHSVIGKPNILSNQEANKEEIEKLTKDQLIELEAELDGWRGDENISHMISVLENFIAKGRTINFLGAKDANGVSYVELIFKMVDKVIQITLNGADDLDIIGVLKLFICLLENYPDGQMLQAVPIIIDKCLELMHVPNRSKGLRVMSIEVIAITFWYNVHEALGHLIAKGQLEFYFETWYKLLKHFVSDYDKQRMLFGLASLMKIPSNEWPQLLLNVAGPIIKEVYKLTNELLELRNQDESGDLDDDEEAEFEEEKKGTDENNISETINKIKGFNKKMEKDNFAKDMDLDEDEDEFDRKRDGATGKALLYDSPLEDIDEIMYLKENLEALSTREPEFYKMLISNLNHDEVNTLRQNFETAHEQHLEYLKKKAEEAAEMKNGV